MRLLKQERDHSARLRGVGVVFAEWGDLQGQGGLALVHASFFALSRLSDAVRRCRNESDNRA